MSLMLLAATPVVRYGWTQALSDLHQIAAIAVVVVALLVAILLDLALPARLRGTAVLAVALAGLGASIGFASVGLWGGGGRSAYSNMVTGDSFALFFELLLGILGVFSVVLAQAYVVRRGLGPSELHVLTLAAIIGMMALASATSLVSVFVALETLSLALYVACGYIRRETRSQESAVKYLLVGGFASAFILYGMALVYGATGSTLIPTIAQRVTGNDITNPLLVLGVLLLAVGFAYKISGAPFHQWTPDVYQGAPLPVTAFMSVGTKAAAFAMIIRVFNVGLHQLSGEWSLLLAFVAVCSMVLGNLAAIVQTSVKRLLAYSGVAQAGYILVGVVASGTTGVGAALFYLVAYLFMNFGAFAVLTALVTKEGERDGMADLNGLGYRNPLLGVLMTFFMLSLGGFPPLVGFWGKFFLFEAGVSTGWTWLVVVAVLASVVSIYYYLRVVFHVWQPVTTERRLALSPASVATTLVPGLLALIMGFLPTFVLTHGLTGAANIFK
ncbi:MAG: NADH-quinone oxidoreductase subunit N [Candidatus Dormibacteraeota bacterium]|nr:NADH-quinone oxidoreductase subunit N [Candidatus Dormibacteraeota bacterium]